MTDKLSILTAISDALKASNFDLYRIAAFVGVALVVLVILRIAYNASARRREDEVFESQFQRQIRKLDLTVRQVDVVDLLATHLHDRSKRYLLLSNPGTFAHCVAAAGRLKPPHDSVLVTLTARLGYDAAERIALALQEFLPSVGSVVKLEQEGRGPRTLAQIVSTAPRTLRVSLEANPGLERGASVEVYAQHPSGLVIARGTLSAVGRNETVVDLTRPFVQPDNLNLEDNTLKVFVQPELGGSEAVPAELHSLWSSGATLDNPDRRYRRRDDLKIVFRRNHAKWAFVNAEVVGVMKRRRIMKVRFSHLSSELRQQILGDAG